MKDGILNYKNQKELKKIVKDLLKETEGEIEIIKDYEDEIYYDCCDPIEFYGLYYYEEKIIIKSNKKMVFKYSTNSRNIDMDYYDKKLQFLQDANKLKN